jgi:alkylhydroperoxidase/carboxymuconolactone decarboxylase family protein YurZ
MTRASATAILDELRKTGDPVGSRLRRPRLLDEKTCGLVAIGAATSIGAPLATYVQLVNQATRAGASGAECIGAVLAVASEAGEARIVTAAPRIAAALGYDIEKALEE